MDTNKVAELKGICYLNNEIVALEFIIEHGERIIMVSLDKLPQFFNKYFVLNAGYNYKTNKVDMGIDNIQSLVKIDLLSDLLNKLYNKCMEYRNKKYDTLINVNKPLLGICITHEEYRVDIILNISNMSLKKQYHNLLDNYKDEVSYNDLIKEYRYNDLYEFWIGQLRKAMNDVYTLLNNT